MLALLQADVIGIVVHVWVTSIMVWSVLLGAGGVVRVLEEEGCISAISVTIVVAASEMTTCPDSVTLQSTTTLGMREPCNQRVVLDGVAKPGQEIRGAHQVAVQAVVVAVTAGR